MNRRMVWYWAVGAVLLSCGLGAFSLRWARSPAASSGGAAKATLFPAESLPKNAAAQARLAEMQTLKQHLKSKPNHIPILFRLAQMAREMGRPAEAAEHFHQILQQEPGNKEARLELGRVLYEMGDIGGAIRETLELLKRDPGNIDALYNIGAIYANLNQEARAREYWLKAISLGPDSASAQLARQGLEQLSHSQIKPTQHEVTRETGPRF
jgi:tetratricopeptide (TPR) repeat protein